MRGLIGDLLDAGRIDAGALSVSPEPAEVGHLVEQARSTFLGGGGRHDIVLDLPAGLPPRAGRPPAHRAGAQQPLRNAARHAPESAPIRVAAGREDAHVAAAVSDEGRGVAPELLPPRRRNPGRPRPRARDPQGAGLGATVTLHAAGGRRGRPAARRPAVGRRAGRAAAQPGGRRRPADAFISAYGRDETVARALEAGAAD